MSVEKAYDYDIPPHGEEDYDIPGIQSDVVKNVSYTCTENQYVDNSTITAYVSSSFCNANSSENSMKEDPQMTKEFVNQLTTLLALQIGITLIIFACFALVVYLQISKLHSDIVLIQSTLHRMETNRKDAQFSELGDRLSAEVTRLEFDSATYLTRLSNDINNRLKNFWDNLSIPLNFLDRIRNENTNSLGAIFVDVLNDSGYSFDSCAAIRQLAPSSQSGNYRVRSSHGQVPVYCDMTRTCGNITGGWMRVAELNLTDTTTQCPSSLDLVISPRRSCRPKDFDIPTCSSDTFTVYGMGYSKVCGRIRAYQIGFLNAFGFFSKDIETYYVDGVSLTHGKSPKQHIWTFAAAINEDDEHYQSKCPCINTAISRFIPPPPSFVGEDYFCATAVVSGGTYIFYADNPLWDGAGCGPRNLCCTFNSPPWFYKQLQQSTTNDIEMRLCRDESAIFEDIAIDIVEIYVQ